MNPRALDIVGVADIAKMLGVAHQTVKTWRHRGVLPEPEATVSGVPVWRRDTIERWARERPGPGRPSDPASRTRAKETS